MNLERIGIIGQGFVGSSIKAGLIKDFPDLLTFDIQSHLSICSSLKELVNECYFIFVCVPTPMEQNGSCHIGIVDKVLKDIEILTYIGDERIVILKTTVPPGTTRKFNRKYENLDIIFNPEFLKEVSAAEDFKNQNRIILGGEKLTVLNGVADFYRKVFPLIPIIYMKSEEAEMVKYLANAFLATKVIFANEMYQICKGLKLDYDKVIGAAKLDTRLGDSHWKVPGPDGDLGFGGSCFPKDMNAIKFVANNKNVETPILDATLEKNNIIRNQKG